MKSTEAWDIVIKELSPIFLEKGFKLKKGKWSGFIKSLDNGFDLFVLGFLNYYPLQVPNYTIQKRFDTVESIHAILVKKFNLHPSAKDTDCTFWFSYESLNGLHTNGYLPPVETAEGMQDNARKIKEFMLETGFPTLGKYHNIEAIDAEINGNDFWHTDWMHKFALGGGFAYKRTIIAYLNKNKNIIEIKQHHLRYWQDNLIQYPDCANLIDAYNYLTNILLE